MNETQESEALYNELYNSATSKKKQTSIFNIKKACNALATKQNKITPASIGKYCEKAWGTPREQSIRNNKNYVRYISKREEERPKSLVVVDSEAPIIVKDQAAQAVIDILQNEIKGLNMALSNLKKGMRQIAPIDIDKFITDNLKGDINFQDIIKEPSTIETVQNTVKCQILIKEIVETLNKHLLEKYCQVSIDFKNDVIFNKDTGATYWEAPKD